MQPHFELQLEERRADRVVVSVLLGPGPDGPAAVDGVAVMLVGRSGETLSHRLLLPIAGTLAQGLVTTVELRSLGPLPPGARIMGAAWRGPEQWDASCPADPGTQMEAHMRGRVVLRPSREGGRDRRELEGLSCSERSALAVAFPWVAPCAPPAPSDPTVMESEDTAPCLDPEDLRAYCEGLGLDEEDTDWLESLLEEP